MKIKINKLKNIKAQAIKKWRLKVDLYNTIRVNATMEIDANDLIYQPEQDVPDGWGFTDHYDAYWYVKVPIGNEQSIRVKINGRDIPKIVQEYVISGKNAEQEAEEIVAYYQQRTNNNGKSL